MQQDNIDKAVPFHQKSRLYLLIFLYLEGGNEIIASIISLFRIPSTAAQFSLMSVIIIFRETTLKFPPSAPSDGMNSEYQITPISAFVPCSDAPILQNIALLFEEKQQHGMIIKPYAAAFHKILLLSWLNRTRIQRKSGMIFSNWRCYVFLKNSFKYFFLICLY